MKKSITVKNFGNKLINKFGGSFGNARYSEEEVLFLDHEDLDYKLSFVHEVEKFAKSFSFELEGLSVNLDCVTFIFERKQESQDAQELNKEFGVTE